VKLETIPSKKATYTVTNFLEVAGKFRMMEENELFVYTFYYTLYIKYRIYSSNWKLYVYLLLRLALFRQIVTYESTRNVVNVA